MLSANEDEYELNEKESKFINRRRKSFQYACNHLLSSCSKFNLYNIIHEYSPVISFGVCLKVDNKDIDISFMNKNNNE